MHRRDGSSRGCEVHPDRRHVERVLRLGAGGEVEVLDGRGGAFRAVYRGAEPPQIEVLAAVDPLVVAEPLAVALGVLKGPRMDTEAVGRARVALGAEAAGAAWRRGTQLSFERAAQAGAAE